MILEQIKNRMKIDVKVKFQKRIRNSNELNEK